MSQFPEKFCIKNPDKDVAEVLSEMLKKDGYVYWYSIPYNYSEVYIHFPKIEKVTAKLYFVNSNYTEITNEQFREQFMKDKKILGWKFKKECEKYLSVIDSIIDKEWTNGATWFQRNYNYNVEKWGYGFADSTVSNSVTVVLNRIGLLDLWFKPVYEEIKQIREIIAGSKNHKITISDKICVEKKYIKIGDIRSTVKHFEENQYITSEWSAKLEPSSQSIKIGCAFFSLDELKKVITEYDNYNKQ